MTKNGRKKVYNELMYYLTIAQNGKDIIVRKPFNDFASAIAYTGKYYQPRARRSILEFSVEVINGEFARAYAELLRPEYIDNKQVENKWRYQKAVKQDNGFVYDVSLFFLIESDIGITDAKTMVEQYSED
ncbi:MAG: hypothetical protein AB1489_12535 [Acidobacteriota bacterium]